MYAVSSVIFISLIITVKSYPSYWSSSSLNPVHGLYVKPSGDGITGDLFVAATEDSGVKSQWAVNQPVNFLHVAPTTQSHAAALPSPYPSFPTTHDESSTQKRAVMPSPVTSPPVQYAYAVPVPSGESSAVASYPYAYPVPANTPESSTHKCDPSSTAPQYPFQFPFQLFYPQMMSAYSNAMSILKDAGMSDDSASTVMAQAAPMWSPSSYAYPMYVMVDPSMWTQNQGSTTPPTSTSAPNTKEVENSQVEKL